MSRIIISRPESQRKEEPPSLSGQNGSLGFKSTGRFPYGKRLYLEVSSRFFRCRSSERERTRMAGILFSKFLKKLIFCPFTYIAAEEGQIVTTNSIN